MSVTPGVEVRFWDTVLYAAEVLDPTGRTVHVLGYQNKVQGLVGVRSLARAWVPFGRSGNAMILPFPAVPRTMTSANVLDTTTCPHILRDVAAAVMTPRHDHTWSDWAPPTAGLSRVQIFEAAGIYTVVLADDPRDIPAALEHVPRSKRPTLNPALFDAFARWYPHWTVALCCFDNRRARLADPLLWWYEPMFPEQLFLPALDEHTGAVPDLESSVAVDHVVAVGSHRMTDGRSVIYRDPLPSQLQTYLLSSLIGRRFSKPLPNGDFVCRLDDVRRGAFAATRVQPTYA